MRANVAVLRIAPVIRYHQLMSRTHQEATGAVHRTFKTKEGRYTTALYSDEWTGRVAASCQLTRKRVNELTVDGLATQEALPEIQSVWERLKADIEADVAEVHQHWPEVVSSARRHLGDTFDASAYPLPGAWGVTARLSVVSAAVPGELSADACEGLRNEAEGALREELIQGSQRAIEEIKELVARVAGSKRAETTRKAALRRIARLKRINLLGDPAYDAVCSAAMRELRGEAGALKAGLFDIDFANPFSGVTP